MADSTPPDRDSIVADAARIYLLPNFFTAGNLFFGFVAIIRCIQAKYGGLDAMGIQERYKEAVWCIFAAFICDGLDGRLARLGGRESLFGKEFDSIADVVSFGVAPALMVFFLILSPTEDYPFFRNVGWLIGFIYLLCAGVRLARFNVLTHPLIQSPDDHNDDFIGLPVPVAAGLIAALTLLLIQYDELRGWEAILPALMLLIAWLMVSNVLYPSFKNIGWQTQARMRTFVLLFIGFVVGWFLIPQFIPIIMFLSYIFFGFGRHILSRLKSRRVKTTNSL